jgi:porphobilinogen synthase
MANDHKNPVFDKSTESPHRPRVGRFPTIRMRRNRRHSWSRRLVREHSLTADDLIWPIFVRTGTALRQPIEALPGVLRYSIDQLASVADEAVALGIPAVAIFPFIEAELKNSDGSEAVQSDNIVCQAITAIKAAQPNLGVICDAALDPFTDHGHDGIVVDDYVVNDASVEILCQQSLVQAAAGCDVIAPSDMMDGRVGAIRACLDAHGFEHVQILAYAAKYASGFYGPFRSAIGSSGNLAGGSKATYQMDPANSAEALREVELDLGEGADMVMVKPAMPYLDIITRVKSQFGVPTFGFQVSGEYAMLQAAGGHGWLDLERVMMESLICIKRAGADGILTYFAPAAARRIMADQRR